MGTRPADQRELATAVPIIGVAYCLEIQGFKFLAKGRTALHLTSIAIDTKPPGVSKRDGRPSSGQRFWLRRPKHV